MAEHCCPQINVSSHLRQCLVHESGGTEPLHSIFSLFGWREQRAERLLQVNIHSRCRTTLLLQNDRTQRLTLAPVYLCLSQSMVAVPPHPPVCLRPNTPWNNVASPHHGPHRPRIAAQGREEAGRRLSPPSSRKRSRRSRSCSRRLRRSMSCSGPQPSPTSSSAPQGARGRTPPAPAATAQSAANNDPISHHQHHSGSVERASAHRRVRVGRRPPHAGGRVHAGRVSLKGSRGASHPHPTLS
jgi:hypothetical protein